MAALTIQGCGQAQDEWDLDVVSSIASDKKLPGRSLSLSLSLSRARALSLSNYQGKNECEKCLGENRSLELRDSTSSAQPHSCYLFFGSEAERDQWCQVLCFYFHISA